MHKHSSILLGEEFKPEERKTKAIFVLTQFNYIVMALLPVPLFFHYR